MERTETEEDQTKPTLCAEANVPLLLKQATFTSSRTPVRFNNELLEHLAVLGKHFTLHWHTLEDLS